MNTEAMFSSKTDLWATPKDFFDRLDAEFGFTLDACALPKNAKCKAYYTPEQDGLAQPWNGVVWCNPPYGRQIGQWVKKAHDTAARGGVRRYAATCSHRYEMVPRLHIPAGGDPLRQGAAQVWRQQEQRAVSEYGLHFQGRREQ